MTRAWWNMARQTILPQFNWQADYQIESIDMVDKASCWFVEVEWLGFVFQVAGGRFTPNGGEA